MKRRSRFPLAVLQGLASVLLWTFVLGPADLWHSRDQEDHASLVLTRHDASLHRIEAATPQTTPEHQHCYVCHWLRSLHTVLVAGRPLERAGLRTQEFPDDAFLRAGLLASGSIPGRSPPA